MKTRIFLKVFIPSKLYILQCKIKNILLIILQLAIIKLNPLKKLQTKMMSQIARMTMSLWMRTSQVKHGTQGMARFHQGQENTIVLTFCRFLDNLTVRNRNFWTLRDRNLADLRRSRFTRSERTGGSRSWTTRSTQPSTTLSPSSPRICSISSQR